MIVRVSARGQANSSADGYLGARGARRQAEYKMRTVDCSLSGFTKCYQNYFWKKSRFGRFCRELCMPMGRLFSKPRLARSRVPRYTGAMVRKSCSSHATRAYRTVRPRLGSMSNVCSVELLVTARWNTVKVLAQSQSSASGAERANMCYLY